MAKILDIARTTPGFSTLVAAVEAAGLVDALNSDGPFTVFAPNDDAFAALPPGTVQTLVQNPPQLARILKYHVASGHLSRQDLIDKAEVSSLEGAPIQIRSAEPFEVKNATVLLADVEADNGVIHVLNRVILPG